jgi:hypothetical protein
MALSQDLREFVESFLSNEVKFVVVGAYAMAYHRLPRLTGDIDLFVSPNEENLVRVCKALDDFGFGSLGVHPTDLLGENQVLQLGRPPNRIDVLTGISGVTFQEAWADKVMGELEGLTVPFISRELLMRNKEASGREKDLLDLKLLRQQSPG